LRLVMNAKFKIIK